MSNSRDLEKLEPWQLLKKHTEARIGLKRSGHSPKTEEHLKFQLDHARARDAIYENWDLKSLRDCLRREKIAHIQMKSAIKNRDDYLKRPDLGRILDPDNRRPTLKKADLVLIVSDGLSASAVNAHGESLIPYLYRDLKSIVSLAPLVLIPNARVALSDQVGALFKAKIALIILGERPGLTAADSLAIYLTYSPRPGRTDAERNCISNIRPPHGLSYLEARSKAVYLTKSALSQKVSGLSLKLSLGSLP